MMMEKKKREFRQDWIKQSYKYHRKWDYIAVCEQINIK